MSESHVISEGKSNLEDYRNRQAIDNSLFELYKYIGDLREFMCEYSAFTQSAMKDFDNEYPDNPCGHDFVRKFVNAKQ